MREPAANEPEANKPAANGPEASRGASTGAPCPSLSGPDLLEIPGSGIFSWKGPPRYGSQDLGYSPGGVQDRFSFHTGQILLGTDTDALSPALPALPALEMIHPPRMVRFRVDCCFVLTGGRVEAVLCSEGDREGRGRAQGPDRAHEHDEETFTETAVEHAVVYHAPAGSVVRFRRREYGFRTYLCCRPAPPDPARLTGRSRGVYHTAARWPDPAGRIRVIAAPESTSLVDPQAFLGTRWRTGGEMNDMGIRLEPAPDSDHAGGNRAGASLPDPKRAIQIRGGQLISAPVCDGTVQMTPSGPIVLLRERQTTGGYPRVCVVTSADLDLLAQMGPGRTFSFLPVRLDEALAIGRQWSEDLERLRGRFRERTTSG
jgi:5-oxoprolinase (ATP-hydrolysing) subunit C